MQVDALLGVLDLVRGGFAPSLRELRLGACDCEARDGAAEQALHALLAEAPALEKLELSALACGGTSAVGLLSLPRLHVDCLDWITPSDEAAPTCEAVLDALERHESLRELNLFNVFDAAANPALLTRVVNLVLTRRLTTLVFSFMELGGSNAPQLARLLREGESLRSLEMYGGSLQGGDATLFADALRANSTLQVLKFGSLASSWSGASAAGPAICKALEGHPSLESLGVYDCGFDEALPDYGVLDKSLAGLLRANSPVFQTFCLSFNSDGGQPSPALPLMFEALAVNTHLRELEAGMLPPNDAFLGGSLLPALRANASLRKLSITIGWEYVESSEDAVPDEDLQLAVPDEDLQRAVNEAVAAVNARADAAE